MHSNPDTNTDFLQLAAALALPEQDDNSPQDKGIRAAIMGRHENRSAYSLATVDHYWRQDHLETTSCLDE
jgi:hypothetical protein